MVRSTFALLAFTAVSLGAQETDVLTRADSLLQHGALARAERLYSEHLEVAPNSVRALLGRATARSWSGRNAEALNDFGAVLTMSPNHTEALIGSGYANVWAGRFRVGEGFFEHVLRLDSDNFEAAKGRAFAALWGGDSKTATARFRSLAENHPDRADAFAGLAQALLTDRRPGEALQISEVAAGLEPGREDVAALRRAAARSPAPVELSLTGGQTRFETAATNPGGAGFKLRSVAVAARPTSDLLLLGQYDDGISVDTRALALTGERAPTYRAAAVTSWGSRFITSGGLGSRSMPDGTRQRLWEVDQAIVLGHVGVSAGWTGVQSESEPGEHAIRGGVTFAPAAAWEFGLTGYNRRIPVGRDGVTLVTTVTHKFTAPVDVLTGVAVGRAAGSGGSQHEAFLHGVARLWRGNGVSLTIRRQFGTAVTPFTVFAGGVTVGLGRG